MNADGTSAHLVSSEPGPTAPEDGAHPTWSPDGSKIAFDSSRGSTTGRKNIWVINADGTGLKNLTAGRPTSSFFPAWSPDGSKIAFDAAATGRATIAVWNMNADGSGGIQLTDNPQADQDPAWSPDNSAIAFASFRDMNWELYVMKPDGSGQRRLTNDTQTDLRPAW